LGGLQFFKTVLTAGVFFVFFGLKIVDELLMTGNPVISIFFLLTERAVIGCLIGFIREYIDLFLSSNT
jgi:hypothetical protein